MVNFQSPVTHQIEHRGPVSGFATQAAGVASDVMELAELQARLAKADAAKVAEHAKPSTFALVVGSCLALSSLPVLSLGIAALIEAVSPLNTWQSQLLVGVVMTATALIVIYLSIRGIVRSLAKFNRSTEQLANNVAWLKAVLNPTQN